MRPSISIITPSFNQGKFIERTIKSVLSQNIQDLEYWIVDGGSSDETLQILNKYKDKVLWISEKDKGQADAVNKGIRMSSGEIIGWINSDDIYYPGTFTAILEYFNKHPEAEIVYGDADHIDLEDKVIEPYYTENWDYERLKTICFICQPSVFFRRKLVERMGLIDERLHYCMDYEYWLRVGKLVRFFRIPRFLAGSRLYRENKTLGQIVSVHKEMNDMLRQRLGMVPAKWIFAFAHVKVNQKHIDRSTPIKDIVYISKLIWVTLLSFLRWRQRPTIKEIGVMGHWILGFIKKIFFNYLELER